MNTHLRKLMVVSAAVVATCVIALASEMDRRIESSAKQSYVFKTYLKNDAITVNAKDGVVSLTGTVADESHKSLAAETVSNLPGVKSVDNELAVRGSSLSENSDAWIAMKVRSVLLFNRNVSTIKTNVTVEQGIVTLRGEAESQAQKDLSGEYAKDVAGVKEVKNKMIVGAKSRASKETLGNKIDDASITAMVKIALLSHRSTSAIKTSVTTTDGIVTLSGTARSGAERDLTAKIARDEEGVKKVTNNMTVEATPE